MPLHTAITTIATTTTTTLQLQLQLQLQLDYNYTTTLQRQVPLHYSRQQLLTITPTPQLQLQLKLHYKYNYTTRQLQLQVPLLQPVQLLQVLQLLQLLQLQLQPHFNYNYNHNHHYNYNITIWFNNINYTTATTTNTLRFPTPHYILQLWVRWPLQSLQKSQPPFRASVDSLCHPCITTTHLSYSFLSLKLPPQPCAVLLVFYRNLFSQDFAYCSSRKAIIPIAMAVVKEKFFAFLTTAASTAHKTNQHQRLSTRWDMHQIHLRFLGATEAIQGLSEDQIPSTHNTLVKLGSCSHRT